MTTTRQRSAYDECRSCSTSGQKLCATTCASTHQCRVGEAGSSRTSSANALCSKPTFDVQVALTS
eukprot:1859876-Prymnesium_polylepis.1